MVDIAPDRPKQSSSLKKLLFFILREGTASTTKKVFTKILKYKKLDAHTIGAVIQQKAAVSFDGGKTFYLHISGPSIFSSSEWYFPFSTDGDFEVEHKISEKPGKAASVFFLGAGDYARTYTLRHFKNSELFLAVDYNDLVLNEISSKFSNTSNSYSAALATWRETENPIAIVATYHSDHAIQTHTLFMNNKNGFIFVEKPPLVDHEIEFPLFKEMYDKNAKIEVGFNRRYAPATKLLLENLIQISGPTFVNISVNEVKISASHWYHWPNQGTRITGNACHWIDFCQLIVQANPVKLTMSTSVSDEENMVLTIAYDNGSLASINLSDSGSELRGVQESIEIKRNGHTFLIDDFLTLRHDSEKGRKIRRFLRRDKGHDAMYASFRRRVLDDLSGHSHFQTLYPLDDLEKVTNVTHEFSQMIKSNVSIKELKTSLLF